MIHRISGKPPVRRNVNDNPTSGGDSQEAENLSTSDEARVTQPTTDRLAAALHEVGIECMRPIALSRDVCRPDKPAGQYHNDQAAALLAALRADRPPEPPTPHPEWTRGWNDAFATIEDQIDIVVPPTPSRDALKAAIDDALSAMDDEWTVGELADAILDNLRAALTAIEEES